MKIKTVWVEIIGEHGQTRHDKIPFDDFIKCYDIRFQQILREMRNESLDAIARDEQLWDSMLCQICQEVKCDDDCKNFKLRKNNA